jgi:hypothetical protein
MKTFQILRQVTESDPWVVWGSCIFQRIYLNCGNQHTNEFHEFSSLLELSLLPRKNVELEI